MPLLGALLASLFKGIAAFFLMHTIKRVLLVIAALGFFTTLTTALFALMRSIIVPMVEGIGMVGLVGQFCGVAIPPVAPGCLSAYITIWSACTLYSWQIKAVNMMAKI